MCRAVGARLRESVDRGLLPLQSLPACWYQRTRRGTCRGDQGVLLGFGGTVLLKICPSSPLLVCPLGHAGVLFYDHINFTVLETHPPPCPLFPRALPFPQGVLFHDRMKPAVLETVRSELVALEEGFLAANPGAKINRVPPPKGAKGFGAPKK